MFTLTHQTHSHQAAASGREVTFWYYEVLFEVVERTSHVRRFESCSGHRLAARLLLFLFMNKLSVVSIQNVLFNLSLTSSSQCKAKMWERVSV